MVANVFPSGIAATAFSMESRSEAIGNVRISASSDARTPGTGSPIPVPGSFGSAVAAGVSATATDVDDTGVDRDHDAARGDEAQVGKPPALLRPRLHADARRAPVVRVLVDEVRVPRPLVVELEPEGLRVGVAVERRDASELGIDPVLGALP